MTAAHVEDARRPVCEAPWLVTVGTADLHLALSNVALCRSNDDARPILTAVLLEAKGPEIRFVATDSYKLGTDVVTAAAPVPDLGASVLISKADVEALLRALKSSQRLEPLATLRFLPGGSAGADDAKPEPAVVEAQISSTRLSIKDSGAADFPNWRHLFEACVGYVRESSGAVVAGLNPINLAALVKVRGAPGDKPSAATTADSCMVFRFPDNPSRPVLVEVGRTFRALLMPVRLPGDPAEARPPLQARELATAAAAAAEFLAGPNLEPEKARALAQSLRDEVAILEQVSNDAASYSNRVLAWADAFNGRS